VQRTPRIVEYTFVKVGLRVSQVTVTLCVVTVVHEAALGNTVTLIVTGPGVAGHVNTGVALSALSNVPAVAVPANVTGTEPAEPVAASAIGVLTAVSRGEALTESRLAQICVVPPTTTVPWPAGAVAQLSVRLTSEVAPALMLKPAEPEQLNALSTDVAVSVIV